MVVMKQHTTDFGICGRGEKGPHDATICQPLCSCSAGCSVEVGGNSRLVQASLVHWHSSGGPLRITPPLSSLSYAIGEHLTHSVSFAFGSFHFSAAGGVKLW